MEQSNAKAFASYRGNVYTIYLGGIVVKKGKRVLALFACAAMVATMAAGCKQGKTSPSSESTPVGKSNVLPYTGGKIEYKGLAADLGMTEDSSSPIFQEYQKMLGNVTIKWELLPWNDYDTKVNLDLNAGDVPDIMWMRSPADNSAKYGGSGMFMNFEKYKKYMPNLQEAAKKYPTINYYLSDNARYALPTIMSTDYVSEGWMYNKTVLDRLGIEVPKTTDDLYSAMLKVRQKDSKVVPFISGEVGYTLSAFARMFTTTIHGSAMYDQSSKKWIFPPSSDPNYKTCIKYVSDCYQNNLFDSALPSMSGDAAHAERANGNWAFTYDYASGMYDTNVFTAGKTEQFDVEPMLTPEFNGKSHYYLTVLHDGASSWAYFASAKAKHPEVLAGVLDLCYSQKANDLYNWGKEGLTYQTTNGKKQFKDNVADGTFNMNKQRFLQLRFINICPEMWTTDYQVTKQPSTRRSAVFYLKALKDGKMTPTFDYPTPNISSDDSNQFSQTMTPVTTFVKESELKFLTGKLKMTDWDKFVSEIKNYGNIDNALSVYNKAKNYSLGSRVYTDPDKVY